MLILLGLYLLAGFSFFLGLIYWAIIIDILLSWLTLLGIQIIIGPLNSITRPLYDLTRKIFPTRVGVIDLSPVIIAFIINFLDGIIIPSLVQFLKTQ